MTRKSQRKKTDFKTMTLDQLADLHDADDEEIEEDAAFDSDDERQYGKYFDNQDRHVEDIGNRSYLGLTVPLSGGEEIVQTEITKGQKMVLSSLCLDVPSGNFGQLKLMVRCIYLGGTEKPWLCLGNFLGQKNGGMAVSPSIPINLEAIGPCKVEWKVEGKIPTSFSTSGINIFGKIVPILQEVFSDDDLSVDYANAFMSESEDDEEEEEEEEAISTANGSAAVKSQDANTGTDRKDDVAKPKKRKLSNAEVDTEEVETAEKSSNNKLTKKQRKQLAREKAQQLEDTLAASRNDEDESKTSKKKKKKKNQTETEEELSRPTSLTRERRLPSGVTVRDLLVGTGAPVKSGKKLSLHYTGSLVSTGKVFDKNHSKQHPLVFRQGTGEVIRGLERGLEGMKVGGERVISIPSKLGYGTKGAGVDIPPDSDLSFEVKLLKVG